MPTSRCAAWRSIVRPPTTSTSPNGMTAKAASAGTRLTSGASACSVRSAPASRTSSFSRNLIGSATSVLTSPRPANPKIAARLAPMRSCMSALALRSKKRPRLITCSMSRITNTASALAMAASTSSRALRRQAVEQLEHAWHVEFLVIGFVVELEHGGRVARAEALDLLQGEAAVGRAFAVADAEPRLPGGEDVFRAAQGAGEVAADLQPVARRRLRPVHRVEGDDRRHPRERQLHQPRDVLLHRRREPAELALREPERRHERGAARGVAREDRVVLGERRRRELRVSGHTLLRSC